MKHLHSRFKATVALCLLLSLLCAVVCAGCAEESDETDTSAADSSEAVSGTAPSDDEGHLVETDAFKGQTIKVFTAAFNDAYVTEIGSNENNETCPKVLSDEIVNRTRLVEDAYGVKIEETIEIDPKRYNGSFLTAIQEFAAAGTFDYDIYYPCLIDAGTMAANGLLLDLSSAEGIDISNPWWDQIIIKDTSIGGSTYYLTGDIGLRAKNAANCIYFNKALFDQYGLEYPYQTVRDMKWTIDEVLSIISQVGLSQDLDGDGIITYHDSYGWSGQNGDMHNLFYASGERIVRPDEQKTLILSMYNQRSSNVVEKILTLMQNDAEYVLGDDFFNESPTPMILLEDAFKANRCLFYSGNTETALRLGDMESEFGILPAPMYDLEQGQYYTMIGAWSSNAYCIPAGLDETKSYQAQVILDALGGYSVDTVAKTYYDVVLQYQKLHTDEDKEMLDIIFSTTGTDLAHIYTLGDASNNLSTMLTSLASQTPGQFTSAYQSLESAAQTALDSLIATFETNKN